MAEWKKVTGDQIPAHDFSKSAEVSGIYTSVSQVGPNNSNLYVLKQENGTEIAIWGSALIDSRFNAIPRGSEVKVKYLGKAKSPKTGREYKNYDIMYREVEQPDINF